MIETEGLESPLSFGANLTFLCALEWQLRTSMEVTSGPPCATSTGCFRLPRDRA